MRMLPHLMQQLRTMLTSWNRWTLSAGPSSCKWEKSSLGCALLPGKVSCSDVACCTVTLCNMKCLQGLERTRGSVIRNEFQGLRQEGNIDEIRASMDGIYEALMDLDIFDDVDMAIQPSRRVSSIDSARTK